MYKDLDYFILFNLFVIDVILIYIIIYIKTFEINNQQKKIIHKRKTPLNKYIYLETGSLNVRI